MGTGEFTAGRGGLCDGLASHPRGSRNIPSRYGNRDKIWLVDRLTLLSEVTVTCYFTISILFHLFPQVVEDVVLFYKPAM